MSTNDHPHRVNTEKFSRYYYLLLLISPILVLGSLNSSFSSSDDPIHVFRPETDPNAPLSAVFKIQEYDYFPLTFLSYRIDRLLYEGWLPKLLPRAGWAPGARITSLAIHILTGLIIWRILLALGLSEFSSWAITLGWMLHPSACESVAWISERKNVLAAFFGFLCTFFFIKGATDRKLIAFSVICFLCSLLCKPAAVGFFAIPVGLLFFVPKTELALYGNRRLRIAAVFMMTAIACMITLININAETITSVPAAPESLHDGLLTGISTIPYYLFHLIVPVSLSIFYQVKTIHSILESGIILSVLCVGLGIFITLRVSRQRWKTIFLWWWFLGALAPALNIFPQTFVMQDRYAYFSLPALLAILDEFLGNVWPSRLGIRIVEFSAIILFIVFATSRSYDFGDDSRLYSDATRKQPLSAWAHAFYGFDLCRRGDLFLPHAEIFDSNLLPLRLKALQEFERSRISPDFNRMIRTNRVRVNLFTGVLLLRIGNNQSSHQSLEWVVRNTTNQRYKRIALLGLAESELDTNPQLSLKYSKDALALYRDEHAPGSIWYMAGQSYEHLGELNLALEAYTEVKDDGFLGVDARAQIDRLKKILMNKL